MENIRGYRDQHLKRIYSDIDHGRKPVNTEPMDLSEYEKAREVFLEAAYLKDPSLKERSLTIWFKNGQFELYENRVTSTGIKIYKL